MDSKLQLTLFRIFLATKIGLNIIIALAVIMGAGTLRENQKWVDHTNLVINEVEIVRNQFQTADYTGRNRNLKGIRAADLGALRQEVFAGIDRVKLIVSDNPRQIENLGELATAIQNRFNSQDEQLSLIQRGETTITYPLAQVSRSSEFMEAIEGVFSEIKLNEINLLRLERQPALILWQWRIVYSLLAAIAFQFAMTIYLNIAYQRQLKKSIYVGERLKEKGLKKLDDYLNGISTKYELNELS